MIVLIHYYGIRGIARWWAPLMTGTCSALWGMGFTGLIGYQLDPVMLVIPFILTARDVSHGIQWQRRFYSEIERSGGDVHASVVSTTNLMLPPGLVSILADIFGIIFVSVQRYSGTASYRADRRGVGRVEPADGLRVSADRDELSATAQDRSSRSKSIWRRASKVCSIVSIEQFVEFPVRPAWRGR